MAAKHRNARRKHRRVGTLSNATRSRKLQASAPRPAREFIRAAMKKMKALPEALGVFPGNGAEGITTKRGRPFRGSAGRVFKHPKSELEAAIQRYVDLFE